jgi:hypothetical protein
MQACAAPAPARRSATRLETRIPVPPVLLATHYSACNSRSTLGVADVPARCPELRVSGRVVPGARLGQPVAHAPDSGEDMACPICSKPASASYRPFCSRRCADVDLARWLNGSYAVPSEDPADAEEAEAALAAERLRPH